MDMEYNTDIRFHHFSTELSVIHSPLLFEFKKTIIAN